MKSEPGVLMKVDDNKNAIIGEESHASRDHYIEEAGDSALAQRSETAPGSVDNAADDDVEVSFESEEPNLSNVSNVVEFSGTKSSLKDNTDNALDGPEREHKNMPAKSHSSSPHIISKLQAYGIDSSSEPENEEMEPRRECPSALGLDQSTAPQQSEHNVHVNVEAISRGIDSQQHPRAKSQSIYEAEAKAPSHRVLRSKTRTQLASPQEPSDASAKESANAASAIDTAEPGPPRVRRPSNKHMCTYCGKEEPYKSSLVRHLRVHTGEKPFPCNFCEKRFSRSTYLSAHVKTHTGEKPYRCTFCHRSYARRAYLVSHTRTHTGEKPFGCTVCGKHFGHRGSLVSHTRTHTGERPFPCTLCEKRFRFGGALIVHMRTHTKERPHECVVCEKRFSTSFVLQRHMRCHTGERPYKCTACGEGCSSKLVLRRHMAIHTGEISFECVLCGLKVPLRTALTKHMKIHTGKRPYKCIECGEKILQKEPMIAHLLIHKEKDGVDFSL